MKKLNLIFAGLMTVIALQIGYGQNSIGIRAGINVGSTSFNLLENFVPIDWNSGPEIGIQYEHEISGPWSIIAGMQYSQKGFSLTQGTGISLMGINLPIEARADFNLDYIETPIAMKYTLGETTQLYGLAGVSTGYATRGTIDTRARIITDINIGSIDIPFSTQSLSRWNVSGLVGIGGSHPVGQGKVFADFRYNHGLTSAVAANLLNIGMKNNGISIGVGYAYSL